jgi:hypothetical protein
VKVEPQGPLSTVKYVPSGGKLKESTAVNGIKYTSSGGECGTAGVEETNGKYTGEAEVEEVGGGLGWV